MWLPTPVYERLPQFWLLVGLLFIAGGMYLGFDYKFSSWYFVIGVLSIIWGIVLFVIRARRKGESTQPASAEEEQAE